MPISIDEHHHFASDARFVSDYGRAVVKLLSPVAGEAVLDLGCGDGTLTAAIQGSGARVIGVEIDPMMVRAAIDNGVNAVLMDARHLDLPETFDAVFSNSALHFMHPFDEVLREVAGVLRPGGRFAGELGIHGNIAAITTALLAVLDDYGVDGRKIVPWSFPTADEWCDLVEAAGFTIDTVHAFHRPTSMPNGLRGWIRLLGRWFLDALPADQQDAGCDKAEALLGFSLKTSGGNWMADYHHLRFRAFIS